MDQLRQVFTTPDGKTFDTKAEALNYLRKPKVQEAMLKATGGNVELSDWLVENQETVEDAFETGVVCKVTKDDRNKLSKALEIVKSITNPKLAFLQENAEQIIESFKWPTVKRMDEAEKTVAARNTLVAASGGNEELAVWVLDNRSAVLEAYKAGIVKREVSNTAKEALAAYQAKKAAEKAAAEKQSA